MSSYCFIMQTSDVLCKEMRKERNVTVGNRKERNVTQRNKDLNRQKQRQSHSLPKREKGRERGESKRSTKRQSHKVGDRERHTHRYGRVPNRGRSPVI